MSLTALSAKPAPIAKDENGVFRVGGTRVRLNTVLGAYHQGCSAEEILLKYPALKLDDIYALITYYLWHREEIDAYLEERRQIEQQTREELDSRFPSDGVRQRLLSRREGQS